MTYQILIHNHQGTEHQMLRDKNGRRRPATFSSLQDCHEACALIYTLRTDNNYISVEPLEVQE